MLLDVPADLRGPFTTGLQVPPVQSIPPFESSSGEEAVELAASAGLILDPWQQYVLGQSLGERSDGKWSAFEVALVVGRQNGKNAILEARELAGLFLFGEQLILHTAHLFKTSEEAFRRILMLIENNPDFDRRVKQVWKSHGNEGIELKGGQRLRFIARTKGSGRGFSGDCVILDEAMFLEDQEMGSLLPTVSARPNPQLWYTSSAGNEESTQLARIVRRGRTGSDKSLAYFDWCAGESDAPDEPETWAKANPGLGIRISTEQIERERASLDPTEFARERLGIGTYPLEEGDFWLVISEAAWRATASPESSLGDPIAFAVDVSPDRSFASIVAAGACGNGEILEVVEHAAGTGWVVDRLAALKERWGPVGIGLDAAGPAGSLVPELQKEGIDPVVLGSRDMAAACGAFYDRINDRSLHHRGQLELTTAIKGARQRPLGDAWAWARRSSSINLSPLVAATIATYVRSTVPVEADSELLFLN